MKTIAIIILSATVGCKSIKPPMPPMPQSTLRAAAVTSASVSWDYPAWEEIDGFKVHLVDGVTNVIDVPVNSPKVSLPLQMERYTLPIPPSTTGAFVLAYKGDVSSHPSEYLERDVPVVSVSITTMAAPSLSGPWSQVGSKIVLTNVHGAQFFKLEIK